MGKTHVERLYGMMIEIDLPDKRPDQTQGDYDYLCHSLINDAIRIAAERSIKPKETRLTQLNRNAISHLTQGRRVTPTTRISDLLSQANGHSKKHR